MWFSENISRNSQKTPSLINKLFCIINSDAGAVEKRLPSSAVAKMTTHCSTARWTLKGLGGDALTYKTPKKRELDAENSIRHNDCRGRTINPLMNDELALLHPPEALISRRVHVSFSLTNRKTRHNVYENIN